MFYGQFQDLYTDVDSFSMRHSVRNALLSGGHFFSHPAMGVRSTPSGPISVRILAIVLAGNTIAAGELPKSCSVC